jgi:hypothetical protein
LFCGVSPSSEQLGQLPFLKGKHMLNKSISQRAGKWLVVATLLGFGLSFGAGAMAQAEPTLNQVYEAAQSGRLEQAQVMMQQVLVAHPGSAKAHFVQAELYAKQGQMGRAREALGSAEKLAPGLPFAKPDAVQRLRTLLAGTSSQGTLSGTTSRALSTSAPVAPAPSFPWGLALALGGGAIALGIFMTRKKTAAAPAYANAPQPAYANSANPGAMQGGLGGPQSFGMNGGGTAAPTYGQQPAYGQPAGSGLGGKVMGGLATGLAVGAGVMAAQAIGKSLMGNNDHTQTDHPQRLSDSAANNDYVPLANNSDLGGQNFGVNDTSSWDDGSAVASSDGGGDWDT